MSGAARLADLVPGAVRRLAAAGVDDPARDARRLLAHAAGIPPARLTLHMQDAAAPGVVEAFEAALQARLRRQPVAQIVGEREFWGRRFRVTRDTLDPRPETEALIAAALEAPFTRVLDLGTGTGAILLTLLAERPGASGVGVDLSAPAADVARANAAALGLEDRARILVSDWFAGVEGRFDLIVSNPPYIAQEEMAALQPEVREWEPHLALTPGGDGLDAYRAIAAGAGTHLSPGGRICVEIGARQGPAVAELFSRAELEAVRIRPDLDGRDRVVCARAPG